MKTMKKDVKNPFTVEKKVVIITGGAGFLGKQYTEALGRAGATVIIWDKYDSKTLKQVVKGLGQSGIRVVGEVVDITDEKAVRSATRKVMKQFKRIDALINNAAMNPKVGGDEVKALFVPYEEYSIDLWEKELRVNLTGMMICTKAVAPIMIQQRAGSVINIASEVANIAHDHRVYNDPRKFKSIAYTTSKTAVLGFTRQWAARLGRYNVRVNAFSPGGVQGEKVPLDFAARFGDMNMLGRMAQIGEYNGIIQFLISDASRFMTGSNLIVDGGKSAW